MSQAITQVMVSLDESSAKQFKQAARDHGCGTAMPQLQADDAPQTASNAATVPAPTVQPAAPSLSIVASGVLVSMYAAKELVGHACSGALQPSRAPTMLSPAPESNASSACASSSACATCSKLTSSACATCSTQQGHAAVQASARAARSSRSSCSFGASASGCARRAPTCATRSARAATACRWPPGAPGTAPSWRPAPTTRLRLTRASCPRCRPTPHRSLSAPARCRCTPGPRFLASALLVLASCAHHSCSPWLSVVFRVDFMNQQHRRTRSTHVFMVAGLGRTSESGGEQLAAPPRRTLAQLLASAPAPRGALAASAPPARSAASLFTAPRGQGAAGAGTPPHHQETRQLDLPTPFAVQHAASAAGAAVARPGPLRESPAHHVQPSQAGEPLFGSAQNPAAAVDDEQALMVSSVACASALSSGSAYKQAALSTLQVLNAVGPVDQAAGDVDFVKRRYAAAELRSRAGEQEGMPRALLGAHSNPAQTPVAPERASGRLLRGSCAVAGRRASMGAQAQAHGGRSVVDSGDNKPTGWAEIGGLGVTGHAPHGGQAGGR
jgi:hypothetical protein